MTAHKVFPAFCFTLPAPAVRVLMRCFRYRVLVHAAERFLRGVRDFQHASPNFMNGERLSTTCFIIQANTETRLVLHCFYLLLSIFPLIKYPHSDQIPLINKAVATPVCGAQPPSRPNRSIRIRTVPDPAVNRPGAVPIPAIAARRQGR